MGTAQTQYTAGLDGNLAATNTRDSSSGTISGLVFNLTNLHGDLVTTATPAASLYDGVVSDSDEYGNTKTASGTRYGWLGGKQRSTEAFGNLTVMGVRLYSPVLGRFLSVDPVFGGNENAYTYPLDPIGTFDLDGRQLGINDGWSAGVFIGAAAGAAAVQAAGVASRHKHRLTLPNLHLGSLFVGRHGSVPACAGARGCAVSHTMLRKKKNTSSYYGSQRSARQAARRAANDGGPRCKFRKQCKSSDHYHVDYYNGSGQHVGTHHFRYGGRAPND